MSIKNVLFCDLETTGLDPEKDFILEAYFEVVAPDLKCIDSRHFILQCPTEATYRMLPAVKAQHFRSGLLDDCEKSSLSVVGIEPQLVEWIREWFPNSKPMLAGNSIHFDKKFIATKWLKVDELLHYRLIDVSSIREAIRIFSSPHRAMEDVQESKETLIKLIGRIT